MDFDENLNDYLKAEFLDYICTRTVLGPNDLDGGLSNRTLEICSASGSTVSGMPNILLTTNNHLNLIFKFSPSDYFIYPTLKKSQTQ